MPVAGQGVWKQTGGDFAYIELEVTGVTYDETSPGAIEGARQ